MYQECFKRVTKVIDSPIFCDKIENTSLFISQYMKVNFLPTSIELGLSKIIFILFWDFLTFYQIFLSPQGERCSSFTYKHGIDKLPIKLPNNLKKNITSGAMLKFYLWTWHRQVTHRVAKQLKKEHESDLNRKVLKLHKMIA